MLPFGMTIPATVPQGSGIPEGLMNNPVYISYAQEGVLWKEVAFRQCYETEGEIWSRDILIL
jgi:hypothetical protein